MSGENILTSGENTYFQEKKYYVIENILKEMRKNIILEKKYYCKEKILIIEKK